MTRPEFEAYTSDAKSENEFTLNDLDDPIPPDLPDPASHRMFVMPVGLKRGKKVKRDDGTEVMLHFADESIDAQKWLNAIGRVAKIGPGCFKHPRYKELGLTDKDFPNVGDLVLYSAHAPLRIRYKGTRFIVINDDQWFGRITDEKTVGYFQFHI